MPEQRAALGALTPQALNVGDARRALGKPLHQSAVHPPRVAAAVVVLPDSSFTVPTGLEALLSQFEVHKAAKSMGTDSYSMPATPIPVLTAHTLPDVEDSSPASLDASSVTLLPYSQTSPRLSRAGQAFIAFSQWKRAVQHIRTERIMQSHGQDHASSEEGRDGHAVTEEAALSTYTCEGHLYRNIKRREVLRRKLDTWRAWWTEAKFMAYTSHVTADVHRETATAGRALRGWLREYKGNRKAAIGEIRALTYFPRRLKLTGLMKWCALVDCRHRSTQQRETAHTNYSQRLLICNLNEWIRFRNLQRMAVAARHTYMSVMRSFMILKRSGRERVLLACLVNTGHSYHRHRSAKSAFSCWATQSLRVFTLRCLESKGCVLLRHFRLHRGITNMRNHHQGLVRVKALHSYGESHWRLNNLRRFTSNWRQGLIEDQDRRRQHAQAAQRHKHVMLLKWRCSTQARGRAQSIKDAAEFRHANWIPLRCFAGWRRASRLRALGRLHGRAVKLKRGLLVWHRLWVNTAADRVHHQTLLAQHFNHWSLFHRMSHIARDQALAACQWHSRRVGEALFQRWMSFTVWQSSWNWVLTCIDKVFYRHVCCSFVMKHWSQCAAFVLPADAFRLARSIKHFRLQVLVCMNDTTVRTAAIVHMEDRCLLRCFCAIYTFMHMRQTKRRRTDEVIGLVCLHALRSSILLWSRRTKILAARQRSFVECLTRRKHHSLSVLLSCWQHAMHMEACFRHYQSQLCRSTLCQWASFTFEKKSGDIRQALAKLHHLQSSFQRLKANCAAAYTALDSHVRASMLASDHKRQSILRYSFSALWMHIATCWQARSAATLACRLTRNIKRLAILVLIWRQYTFIHRDTRGHASAEFRALQLLANTGLWRSWHALNGINFMQTEGKTRTRNVFSAKVKHEEKDIRNSAAKERVFRFGSWCGSFVLAFAFFRLVEMSSRSLRSSDDRKQSLRFTKKIGRFGRRTSRLHLFEALQRLK